MPITPAPTTTREFGSQSSETMSSESRTVRPSNATVDGRAGRVPIAITILAAVTRRSSPEALSTHTACGSRKRPCPGSTCTWLRPSWLRTTSTSRWMTCWMRANTSSLVMSSFTR